MSDFNAEDFLSQQTNEAMQDGRIPIPEGEYTATVGDGPDDLKFEPIAGKKDPTKTFYNLTLWWIIHDDNLKAKLGRDVLRVRDRFFVDIKDGKLASGPEMNVDLGNRRQALGLNTPGQPFALGMLRGKGPCKIRVKQRANPDDPKEKFSEVARAAPMN